MSVTNVDVRSLDNRQLDALREMANIGAGHAATALSRMTGRRISVDVPDAHILKLEEVGALLGQPEEVVTAVTITLDGDLTGRMAQVFPGPTVRRLAAELLHASEPGYPELDELQRSAIAEASNIIVGAYISTLSELLGIQLLMSVPALETDMAAALMTTITLNFDMASDEVFCVNTRVGFTAGAELPAYFLLLPDSPSLGHLLRALRVS